MKPHIWDNSFGCFSQFSLAKKPQKRNLIHDTTGSTIDVIQLKQEKEKRIHRKLIEIHEKSDLSRTEIEKKNEKMKKRKNDCRRNSERVNKNPSRKHHHHHPQNQKESSRHHGERRYVTNDDRANAVPPQHLGTWSFNPCPSEKYDPEAAKIAFADYARRMKKKTEENRKSAQEMVRVAEKNYKSKREENEQNQRFLEQQQQVPEKNQTFISKFQTEKSYELTNKRNDEVKIDRYHFKTKIEQPLIKANIAHPSFYGTIEAEQCANKVAQHLTLATDNLKRLQFITDAVFPASKKQTKTIQTIGNEIKEFNAQLRLNRAKIPKNPQINGGNVAHFVIDEFVDEK